MLQTYVPLYRKYRPQNFQDLVGQAAISQTLSNAILYNRVAHAYLFTGPRGTGKTSAARILAKSLNCEKGPTDKPCGVCSSCTEITRGTALDVIEIDAASNRSVEDARDLIDRVQFAPVSGRYKVYIIDEVHMLTPQAFNTLLKTLEEPPPNLVFVLATTEAHKVLETIVSRCQRFDFRRISQDAIVGRLRLISDLEDIKIADEALNMIARRSSGGLRDALGLLDQISVLSTVNQKIEIKDVLSLIGALPEDMLIKISDAIARKDGSNLLKLINVLMTLGSEPLQIVKELTIHFRNLLIASTVQEDLKDIIDASEEFYDDLKNIAAQFKQVELAQIIDKLAYAERMVRNSSQPLLWIEVGLLSICYRQEIFIVEELQKRIEDLECIVASGAIPPELTYTCEQRPQKQSFTPPPVVEKPARKKPEEVSIPAVKEEVKVAKIDEIVQPPPVEIKSVASEPRASEVKLETAPVLEKLQEPEHVEQVEKSPLEEKVEVQEAAPGPLLAAEVYPVETTWKAIINAISSPPTRGLLTSLATPMAMTSEEVVIGFAQDIFIDDIKNDRKLKSLKDALNKVFGKVPRLTFKLLTEQEQKVTPKINIESPPVAEKKIVEKPALPANSGEVLEENDMKPEEQEELQVDQTDVTIKNQIRIDLSEQARLVQDVFQGKILNK